MFERDMVDLGHGSFIVFGYYVICRYRHTHIHIYIYIYMVPPPPPMYPRLSSQSRLWEGMGS